MFDGFFFLLLTTEAFILNTTRILKKPCSICQWRCNNFIGRSGCSRIAQNNQHRWKMWKFHATMVDIAGWYSTFISSNNTSFFGLRFFEVSVSTIYRLTQFVILNMTLVMCIVCWFTYLKLGGIRKNRTRYIKSCPTFSFLTHQE